MLGINMIPEPEPNNDCTVYIMLTVMLCLFVLYAVIMLVMKNIILSML